MDDWPAAVLLIDHQPPFWHRNISQRKLLTKIPCRRTQRSGEQRNGWGSSCVFLRFECIPVDETWKFRKCSSWDVTLCERNSWWNNHKWLDLFAEVPSQSVATGWSTICVVGGWFSLSSKRLLFRKGRGIEPSHTWMCNCWYFFIVHEVCLFLGVCVCAPVRSKSYSGVSPENANHWLPAVLQRSSRTCVFNRKLNTPVGQKTSEGEQLNDAVVETRPELSQSHKPHQTRTLSTRETWITAMNWDGRIECQHLCSAIVICDQTGSKRMLSGIVPRSCSESEHGLFQPKSRNNLLKS